MVKIDNSTIKHITMLDDRIKEEELTLESFLVNWILKEKDFIEFLNF